MWTPQWWIVWCYAAPCPHLKRSIVFDLSPQARLPTSKIQFSVHLKRHSYYFPFKLLNCLSNVLKLVDNTNTNVMHTNKAGSKWHVSILRYGQLKLARGVKNYPSLDFEIFDFLHILICFYHLHVISYWLSNIFPQKIQQFLQLSNPKL